MQKFIFIFSFLLIANFSFAQVNLVPNPSFEDTLGCPQGYPDLDTKCQFWKSFRHSPDYINNCSSVCGYYNQYGYQQPNSGQAYAGIATYQVTNSTVKEHIGVQFISPLDIGVKYYVSFYVSPSWNNLLTNIATNKIGALVTTYQYSDPSGSMPMPNSCTFYSDTIIKDTLIWHKISGSFIADSAYQYLVIGNFFDDIFVDTVNLPYQVVPQVAYYYLDDVCVSTDSVYSETWTGLTQEDNDSEIIKTYPNPANSIIYVKTSNFIQEIEITNSLGQIVFKSAIESKTELEMPCNNFENGLYFLRIKTTKGLYTTKFIINH